MTLDVMRGRGAFKCGCGARIRVVGETQRTDHCCVVLNGIRCRQSPSTEPPVLLCAAHLKELKIVTGLIKPEDFPNYSDLMTAATMGAINGPEFDQEDWLVRYVQRRNAAEAARWANREHDPHRVEILANPTSVVYFIRMGDMIKIGTSTNLRNRVLGLSLTMSHVLATEPGSTFRESELHEQFREHRAHGEWFRAEPDLIEYIEGLEGFRNPRRAS